MREGDCVLTTGAVVRFPEGRTSAQQPLAGKKTDCLRETEVCVCVCQVNGGP